MPFIKYVCDLNNDSPELRDCLHCHRSGSWVKLEQECKREGYPTRMIFFFVRCTDCGMRGPEYGADRYNWRDEDEAKLNALRAWNGLHRPCDDPPPQKPRETPFPGWTLIRSLVLRLAVLVDKVQKELDRPDLTD